MKAGAKWRVHTRPFEPPAPSPGRGACAAAPASCLQVPPPVLWRTPFAMLLLVCLLGLGLLALLDASLNRTRGLCPRQLQGDFHRLAAPGTRAAALTLSMQQFDEVMLHCRAPPHSARAALALRCALCTGDATAAGQRALQALDRDLQGPGPAHWTGTVLPAVLRAGDVATVLWLGAGPYAVVLGQALLMEGGMVLVTADPRPERRGYGGTTHVQVRALLEVVELVFLSGGVWKNAIESCNYFCCCHVV